MKEYYTDYHGPVKYDSIEIQGSGPQGSILATVNFSKDRSKLYWLVQTQKGLKIDWKASAGYNPLALRTFRSDRPSVPEPFRVWVILDKVYYSPFSDNRQWISLFAESDDGERVQTYVRRQSEAGKALYEILKDGKSHPVMLSLGFTNGKASEPEVLALVADGWIEPVDGHPAALSGNDQVEGLDQAKQEAGLPSGVATDEELDNDLRGIVFVYSAGRMKGGEWSQQYGRLPTVAEYREILEAFHMNRPDELAKDQKEARVNRRLAYEFQRGFQEGCKAAIEQRRPAF